MIVVDGVRMQLLSHHDHGKQTLSKKRKI